jgi:anaerobic selenocysteine-containing dehydrogenase
MWNSRWTSRPTGWSGISHVSAAGGWPCPRQRRKFNAQLDFLGAPADIILHPDTAAERGIVDGRPVRIFNKAGEITLTAKVDPSMRKEVCSIPHGHKHANVNLLTSTDDIDPLGGMALYSGVPIEIEPAVAELETFAQVAAE